MSGCGRRYTAKSWVITNECSTPKSAQGFQARELCGSLDYYVTNRSENLFTKHSFLLTVFKEKQSQK